MAKTKVTEVGPVTNGGAAAIEMTMPYVARVRVKGDVDFLFHGWNCEAVEEKGKAAKGSKAKKTDDLESYVYRNGDGVICIPGTYLRGSIINMARSRQDPRSPRKSAMDLFKAGVIPLTILAPLGVKVWDYEAKHRVVVQRNGITRTRPAMKAGWEAEFDIMVNIPEYISPEVLHETISQAGRLIGMGDFRPTYGRFQVTSFKVISGTE